MDSDFSKTQEFYDLMSTFEHTHKHLRLDREIRGDTPTGYWYQSGETNEVFKTYLEGYMNGRSVYLNHADDDDAELSRLLAELARADVALSEAPFHGQEELSEASLADGIRNYRNAVEDELARLRAANAELVEALKKIARGVDCPEGRIERPDFYASQDYFEHIANEALSRAEQAKPETCVWDFADPENDVWVTGCGTDYLCPMIKDFHFCPGCGKRIEVRP